MIVLNREQNSPLHEHDCDKCVYLGTIEAHQDFGGGKQDLYFHPSDKAWQVTAISRYGKYGEYSSGLFCAMSEYDYHPTKIATELAYQRGLLTDDVLAHHDIVRRGELDYVRRSSIYGECWVCEQETQEKVMFLTQRGRSMFAHCCSGCKEEFKELYDQEIVE